MKFVYFYLLLSLTFEASYSQKLIVFKDKSKIISISNKALILDDKLNNLQIKDVLESKLFKESQQNVPNFQITKSSIWVKLKILNKTDLDHLTLELPYPTIDSITFINVLPNNNLIFDYTGEYIPISNRSFHHQNYIFNLNIKRNQIGFFLLKIKASEQIQLPLLLGSEREILESNNMLDLIFGIYTGIIFVMFFYNIFVYFSIKDNTYLIYVLYILSVGFTQGSLQGYTFRYLYPTSVYLPNLMLVIAPVFSGIFAILFVKKFILTQQHTPILNKILNFVLGFYILILTIGLFGFYHISAELVQINAGIASLLVLITSYTIYKMHYKPALFFLVAWSIFLTSVIVFVLRNFNILPYNSYTYYALQIGSALEVILLSFALADKINIYKKEKEISQAVTLSALEENDRIIREQNSTLERKVKERTNELVSTNKNLSKTLTDLKF
ncbi:MAG: hypothetical protein EOP43_01570 [Sphingobacteriaceae bacterium]|nr:MAG: hypothetical protein EOP43_01570 [Sphingobacteriaceae bacterium]